MPGISVGDDGSIVDEQYREPVNPATRQIFDNARDHIHCRRRTQRRHGCGDFRKRLQHTISTQQTFRPSGNDPASPPDWQRQLDISTTPSSIRRKARAIAVGNGVTGLPAAVGTMLASSGQHIGGLGIGRLGLGFTGSSLPRSAAGTPRRRSPTTRSATTTRKASSSKPRQRTGGNSDAERHTSPATRLPARRFGSPALCVIAGSGSRNARPTASMS